MRRLGELGCSDSEARDRLKFLLKGLSPLLKEENCPLTTYNRKFIEDMGGSLASDVAWVPTYGQVIHAQELFDRYCL